MRKVSEEIVLMVLLVLVATCYMTQAAAVDDVDDNSLHNHTLQDCLSHYTK